MIQHQCGLQYTKVCPGALLHLISSFILWALTSPTPLPSLLCLLCCRFHSSWASYACTSLCLWNLLPDRWNAVRMSSAAAFPAGLHAKDFSVKGGRQLVIYCCNKHWQANDNILCCVLLAVLFILPRDFWLCSVCAHSGWRWKQVGVWVLQVHCVL